MLYWNSTDHNHYQFCDCSKYSQQLWPAQLLLITCMMVLFLTVHCDDINLSNSAKITQVVVDVSAAPIRCSNSLETLKLTMELNQTSVHNPLFQDNTNLVTLNLIYDKTTPHFEIYRTTLNQYNIYRTDHISDNVYYKRESQYPQQFKSLSEFYGTIEGISNDTIFVRASVHFVNCNHVFLFGFIRIRDELYQIRPSYANLKLVEATVSQVTLNVHEIILVTSNMNSELFSINSQAIQNHLNFAQVQKLKKTNLTKYEEEKAKIENKFCPIDTRMDDSFYKLMNGNMHQAIVYVQQVMMLANEVLKNIEWQNEHHSLYGFSLNHINVNHSFGDSTSSQYMEGHLLTELMEIEPDTRKSDCLLHLFTAKSIKSTVDGHQRSVNGVSIQGGMFTPHNVGATSLSACVDDSWNMRCMLIFAHELAHSMGATHEDELTDHQPDPEYQPDELMEDDEKDKEEKIHTGGFLMMPDHLKCESNNSAILPADNLKMANRSVEEVSKFWSGILPNFINATDLSYCGNGIIEQGEECDEGAAELCCYKCQFKKFAQCSPFNSLCCNNRCRFKQVGPCMPWNYCNDKEHFCQNSEVFCRPEKINVQCDKVMRNLAERLTKERAQMTKKSLMANHADLSTESSKVQQNSSQELQNIDSNSLFSGTLVLTLCAIIMFVAIIIPVAFKKFHSYNAVVRYTHNAEAQTFPIFEMEKLNPRIRNNI